MHLLSGVFWTLLVFAGLGLILLAIWVALLPWSLKPFFKLLLWPRYGIYVRGIENVPLTGPVVLTGNHVSWIDGFLIASVCPRPITVLVNKDYCDIRGLRWLAKRAHIIPIPSKGPTGQRIALETMRTELDRGSLVGLFPEAQLCRSGMMNPFLRGIEMILKDKPNAVVIPIGLAGVWGSIFSFSDGKFFKKWPKGLRRKVGISFGPALPSSIKAIQLRPEVLEQIVYACELIPGAPIIPDQVNLRLGHWADSKLGLLTASAADFLQPNRRIDQIANKPGSVGQPVPGVSIRVVSAEGEPLSPNQHGRIEALCAGQNGWQDTGQRGKIEADGFVWLEDNSRAHITDEHFSIIRKPEIENTSAKP